MLRSLTLMVLTPLMLVSSPAIAATGPTRVTIAWSDFRPAISVRADKTTKVTVTYDEAGRS
jgi:hypothetical protein